MWLAVRRDLPLSRGKRDAQVGHAFGRLYLNALGHDPEKFQQYLADNEPKITVRVDSEAELLRVAEECRKLEIPCELIRDAGRSEIAAGTVTVCAFGPDRRENLSSFLRRLQLWKDPASPEAPSTETAD